MPLDVFEADLPLEVAANSYLVHTPYISFHSLPRTFRRGWTKNSPSPTLINNSWFWGNRNYGSESCWQTIGSLTRKERFRCHRILESLVLARKRSRGTKSASGGYGARLASNIMMMSVPEGKKMTNKVANRPRTVSGSLLCTIKDQR